MPRAHGVRQLPSKKCGCATCRAKYPVPERAATKNCSALWQFRYYDAAGDRQSGTRKTKDEAIAARNAAQAAVDAGTYLDPRRGKISVSEWRVEWLKGRNVAGATTERNASHWNAHVEPRWGKTPLLSISYMEVQAWVVGLEKHLGASSVGSILNTLDMMLAAAFRDKRVHYNPCDGVKVKADPKKHAKDDRPPTIEQVQASVAKIVNPVYRQLPLVILETGLRWGEAAGLLPDAVDLDEGLVYVLRVIEEIKGKRTLREYPKSDAGFRSVPLTSAGRALFKLQFEVQPLIEGKPVFRGARGAYLSRSNYRRIWTPATIEAGVHRQTRQPGGNIEHWPTMHDIRHLWHSRLEQAGVPESTRKEMMGHERPKNDVTWRYTHGAEEVRAMMLRALGDEVEEVELAPFRPVRLRLVPELSSPSHPQPSPILSLAVTS
jgi:integrase